MLYNQLNMSSPVANRANVILGGICKRKIKQEQGGGVTSVYRISEILTEYYLQFQFPHFGKGVQNQKVVGAPNMH